MLSPYRLAIYFVLVPYCLPPLYFPPFDRSVELLHLKEAALSEKLTD
jgi:hypothetical protein